MIILAIANACFASRSMPLANTREQEFLKRAKSSRIVCHSRSQHARHLIDTFHRFYYLSDLNVKKNYATTAKSTEV